MRRARSIGRAQPGTAASARVRPQRPRPPAAPGPCLPGTKPSAPVQVQAGQRMRCGRGSGGLRSRLRGPLRPAGAPGRLHLALSAVRSCARASLAGGGGGRRSAGSAGARATRRFRAPVPRSLRPVAAGRSPVAQRGRAEESPRRLRGWLPIRSPPRRPPGCIVMPALRHLGGGRRPCRRDPSLPGRAGSGDAGARSGTRPGAPVPAALARALTLPIPRASARRPPAAARLRGRRGAAPGAERAAPAAGLGGLGGPALPQVGRRASGAEHRAVPGGRRG